MPAFLVNRTCLPELVHSTCVLAVEFPRLLVLENFDLPSLGVRSEVARVFMASMSTVGSLQVIQGLTEDT